MDIILASASPRRRELLTQAGIRFDVCPGMVEEKMTGDTPELMVQSLARQKAEDVFDNYEKQEAYGSFSRIYAITANPCDPDVVIDGVGAR